MKKRKKSSGNSSNDSTSPTISNLSPTSLSLWLCRVFRTERKWEKKEKMASQQSLEMARERKEKERAVIKFIIYDGGSIKTFEHSMLLFLFALPHPPRHYYTSLLLFFFPILPLHSFSFSYFFFYFKLPRKKKNSTDKRKPLYKRSEKPKKKKRVKKITLGFLSFFF